ncbi:hypothetical protein OHV08_05330 [Streptomyces canus]|uniref:hypothetical protein n=1 Tax=Streptomyces canus TaxID=58343 RepID=UPI00324C373A
MSLLAADHACSAGRAPRSRSGTSVGPCRADPTSSAALDGPAPRPAVVALGARLVDGGRAGLRRDRRSALHEALPHIRKEISQ